MSAEDKYKNFMNARQIWKFKLTKWLNSNHFFLESTYKKILIGNKAINKLIDLRQIMSPFFIVSIKLNRNSMLK